MTLEEFASTGPLVLAALVILAAIGWLRRRRPPGP